MSLLNLDFSKSLLGGEDGPSQPEIKHDIQYNSTVELVSEKKAVLSSGKTVTLKPKKHHSDLDPRDEAPIIDIGRLRRKVEVEQKLRQHDNARLKRRFGTSTGLWTEKYRPKNFFELLGNERTNRHILEWLNHWNECVFKTANFQEDQPDEFGPVDPLHRPYHKILMIHGPPGTGKTSIAHVVAEQLGYEVSEINASDERAGQTVRDKLRNSMQNNSLSGKPVCLILDEVDGASEFGFVRGLLDLLYEDRRAVQGKKKARHLRRPIIAICNDVYANALEKLRPFCEVVPFRKASPRQVKGRLRKVCKKEGLEITDKIVDAIVEATSGDVRSCINFLQFHGSEDSEETDPGKDTQVGWYLLLNEIFQRSGRMPKQEQLGRLRDSMSTTTSNLDRIANGCFNAMLDCEGSSLKKVDEVADWLYFQDTVANKMRSTELSYYGTLAPMKFFETFNEVEGLSLADKQRLSFKSRNKYYDVNKQVHEELHRIARQMALHGVVAQRGLLACELPILNSTMVPTGLQLRRFMEDELGRLDHACQVADSLGFKYETRFSDDHTYQQAHKTHLLRPDVSVFVDDLERAKQNRYIERMQLEAMKRKEAAKVRAEFDRKRKLAEEALAQEHKRHHSDGESEGELHVDGTEFHSRYQKFTTQMSHQKEGIKANRAVMSENENRIWVKYHEGFSNAVRKEITWEMLF